ncbi:MAG TPA: P1 family peptidase [Actinomycetota bacterium]|nr:P1 family peptidase [Actinomycetota bacterium]
MITDGGVEVVGGMTKVRGIRVGHHTDRIGITGCTVVLCPPDTVGSVEVRGGAPGTRETDALRPGTLVDEVHAVLLTGGSAFGLAAADGVMRFLEERAVGFDVGVARVPIVPAAVLFDLGLGDPGARPDAEAGYAACGAASDGEVPVGSVGAGTGATVAKSPDPALGWKGGIGTVALERDGLVVGALAAVNAVGAIVEDDGTPIAATRGDPDAEPIRWPGGPGGSGPPSGPGGPGGSGPSSGPGGRGGTNTTLAVVATNATLNKERAQLLALAGHEGLARAVRPSHTIYDGDTVFALATGEREASQAELEAMAAAAVAEAIRRGVRAAEELGGVPGIGGSEGSRSAITSPTGRGADASDSPGDDREGT